MILLSVIIPTHNGAKRVEDTLLSLRNQKFNPEKYEIILVNNNSTDNTSEVVKNFNKKKGKKAIYIKETSIGLHNARHAGAKTAKGEIVAYVDDDVICDENWLSNIIKSYENPDVGCVGGKILPRWEAPPPLWVSKIPSWCFSLMDYGEEFKEVKCLYGCNLSIRKDLLFKHGGFTPDSLGDKKLKWYRGDGEYAPQKKISMSGKKILYNPNAIVWHIIPKERITIDYVKKRYFNEGITSSFIYYRGNGVNLFSISKMLFLSILQLLINILIYFITLLFARDYYPRYYSKLSYNQSRIQYTLNLITDRKLRQHLKRKDWLNQSK